MVWQHTLNVVSYNINENLYHIQNNETSSISLWRENSSLFRVIEFDRFLSLLTGSDYTLIERRFLPIFDELLANEIEIKPVKIYRKLTGETWDSYAELIIKEHIIVDKNEIRFNQECNVWQYKHHLFLSESMGTRINKMSKGSLILINGFARFG